MDILTAGAADNLFSAAYNQSANMDTLANQALSSGITKYIARDFEGAAKDFSRSFGLSPYSEHAYDATKYTSMAYKALGQTEKAVKAYERAIQVNPTDDRLQLEMGNLLFGQERYGEAIEAYEEAVRLYDDGTNRFSLGQAYLKTNRYREAENQFSKIIQRGGEVARNGHFGLGQTYRTEKRYGDAIAQFERAFSKDGDFYEAYAEMGYSYADAGMLDKAEAVKNGLAKDDPNGAFLLDNYISKMTRPKIMFAYANSTFKYFMNPKTPVSALDDYLANSGAEKSFTLKFQFNKEMVRESVENIFNWNIGRSTESAPGMRYNNGVGIPSTEIKLPRFPADVYYDADAMTATLRFSIRQNDDANGTIDPCHIVFAFSGQDADGNDMDVDYDQYMGFSHSF
jgi:tetratricopeptide (TPR) repeat protein